MKFNDLIFLVESRYNKVAKKVLDRVPPPIYGIKAEMCRHEYDRYGPDLYTEDEIEQLVYKNDDIPFEYFDENSENLPRDIDDFIDRIITGEIIRCGLEEEEYLFCIDKNKLLKYVTDWEKKLGLNLNDDVQFENTQKKAHKLQQMVNKDEQVKLKIKEWDETLRTIIINLMKLEGLSNDAGLKAFYNECYGRMERGEDVESYEEDFVTSVLGLKENLIDIINQMRFK